MKFWIISLVAYSVAFLAARAGSEMFWISGAAYSLLVLPALMIQGALFDDIHSVSIVTEIGAFIFDYLVFAGIFLLIRNSEQKKSA